MYTKFWSEAWKNKKRDIIRRSADWIYPIQQKVQKLPVVKTVTNLAVSDNARDSLLAEQVSAYPCP
jgi:hypothetical protein